MSAMEEIKGLIEKQNTTITALREKVEGLEGKAADAVVKDEVKRLEGDIAAVIEAKTRLEAEHKAVETRLAAAEAAAARSPRPGPETRQADEYKEAFFAHLRAPKDVELEGKLQVLSKKATAVSGQALASGQYAVPEEISREIVKQVQDLSPVRSLARVIQVGTPDYKELVNLNGFGAEWQGEEDTRNQTNTPDLGQVTPTMGSLNAKPEATYESLDDIFFNVEAWLQEAAADQYAISEGIAFISGDGNDKPTGFLNGTPVATADAGRAFGTLQYIPTGVAGALSADPFDQLLDLIYTLKEGYRTGAAFTMNSPTMAALAKVKDGDGRYMLQSSVSQGVPDRLHGYPARVLEHMPAIAADAFPIAFGNFRRGYLIVDRVGMRIIRDNVTKPGFVKWIMSKRVGGAVKDSNAIKLLKVATA